MFGTPVDPDRWRAYQELGIETLGLMLPSVPRDESLKLLDEFAEAVSRFERG
jgi:hypothetical protein